MSRGILFIISGPSGTGKGTICAELRRREEMFLSVSNTTRSMRNGETDGVEYKFISVDKFEKEIDRDGFLEYAKYGENYYGTPRMPVEENLAAGVDVILEIEPRGAFKVKKQIPDAVMIFVVPPSMEELKKRLVARDRESAEQIEERMKASAWEFSQAPKYNYICVNDDLDRCVEEIEAIIHRTRRDRDFVEKLLDSEIR